MSVVRFEPIEEQHLPEVLSIYNHYVEHTTVSFHTETLSLEQMRVQIMNVPTHYKSYVIIDEPSSDTESASSLSSSGIAGYILMTQHKNKQAYDVTAEVTVYLKPGQTGRGLGGKSLSFLEQAGIDSGFHVLIATVCTENVNSIALFERYGYEKCAHFREVGYKFGRRLDIASYQKIIG
ncbi:GNAT family N-acetyltransferase [Paenibacillus sp. PsM32]|uniref:GNAT family N-acetyltransferase n=1 Tax=Paenibacillus sp. PsM32 TaxID=3030536 RepID=UPI00263B33D5|nr:GNAT family N-acetyltransferase [Paenibacillus sp. PsM32]MDN4619973.1 GNAT family N-acetyltransferase [Paenibacillus sp. PsM32]